MDINYLGYIASGLGALSLSFQMYHTIKSRTYKGLSISRVLCDIIGCILWIIYGSYISNISVLSSAAYVLFANVVILLVYFYDKYFNRNIVYENIV